jgi:hypothetical protein
MLLLCLCYVQLFFLTKTGISRRTETLFRVPSARSPLLELCPIAIRIRANIDYSDFDDLLWEGLGSSGLADVRYQFTVEIPANNQHSCTPLPKIPHFSQLFSPLPLAFRVNTAL